MNELKEALDVLKVLSGRTEPTRYRLYELFKDEAAALLAHIEAQDAECKRLRERIAELEAEFGPANPYEEAPSRAEYEHREQAKMDNNDRMAGRYRRYY